MRYSNLFAVVLFMVALGVSGSVAADSTTSLTGSYTLDADESDELSEVFEPALEDMGRIRRGIARRVLERQDGPGERMQIEEGDDAIRIDSSNEPTRTIPLDGEAVEHENSDGDVVELRAGRENGNLVIYTDSDRGEYTSEYQLSDDGERLDIVMEMDMDDLSRIVEYRLVYRR